MAVGQWVPRIRTTWKETIAVLTQTTEKYQPILQTARQLLLQALPIHPQLPASENDPKPDVVESSYLHRKAADIKEAYGIEPQWEVLHGEPVDALRRHLNDMPETMLAMTTHGRGPIERTVLGSVAGACVRHVRVPLLLYWPHL